jgi:hypothetical protein
MNEWSLGLIALAKVVFQEKEQGTLGLCPVDLNMKGVESLATFL